MGGRVSVDVGAYTVVVSRCWVRLEGHELLLAEMATDEFFNRAEVVARLYALAAAGHRPVAARAIAKVHCLIVWVEYPGAARITLTFLRSAMSRLLRARELA